ncbi:MAG: 4-(cytidine 5'-diphospho)-2-C-methyl-D-erythritol kinase [Planctomycetes bacterium]|nr:4-(cytidine 5'-diphospho)-2-C-methyl-D-erythritol kinase [Planctomycetota bacterium]
MVWAPAKLNLFLEVLAKRSDGYHEIESVMVTVSLYDALCFREDLSGELSFRWEVVEGTGSHGACRGVSLPEGRENLVVQAAELLRRHSRVWKGARMHLTKRIPIAAGLAGGSSDAAAALVALNRLWSLGLSAEELGGLAAQLGSDVPFFLFAPAAVCRGRGERVAPLRFPSTLHFVVTCPSEALSTARVYGACQPARHPAGPGAFVESLKAGRLDALGRQLFNRLQPTAEGLCEAIGQQRRVMSGCGVVGHQMSGSGPSYYGLCRSAREARRVAARLAAQGVPAFAVRTSP